MAVKKKGDVEITFICPSCKRYYKHMLSDIPSVSLLCDDCKVVLIRDISDFCKEGRR